MNFKEIKLDKKTEKIIKLHIETFFRNKGIHCNIYEILLRNILNFESKDKKELKDKFIEDDSSDEALWSVAHYIADNIEIYIPDIKEMEELYKERFKDFNIEEGEEKDIKVKLIYTYNLRKVKFNNSIELSFYDKKISIEDANKLIKINYDINEDITDEFINKINHEFINSKNIKIVIIKKNNEYLLYLNDDDNLNKFIIDNKLTYYYLEIDFINLIEKYLYNKD